MLRALDQENVIGGGAIGRNVDPDPAAHLQPSLDVAQGRHRLFQVLEDLAQHDAVVALIGRRIRGVEQVSQRQGYGSRDAEGGERGLGVCDIDIFRIASVL